MIRDFMFVVGVLLQMIDAEKIIRMENFLENVNFRDPKKFYVRNNLGGDVVFQDNETASLLAHVSANDNEMERVNVVYNLLDAGDIVDIQVFITPETAANWPLISSLAGASFCLAVIIAVLIAIVIMKRKKKRRQKLAAKGDRLEMKELGQAVAVAAFEEPDGQDKLTLDEIDAKKFIRPVQPSPIIQKKVAAFEEPDGQDKLTLDEIDAKKSSRPVKPSPTIQRKMAKFEKPKVTPNETDSEKEETCASNVKHFQDTRGSTQESQSSGLPGPQTSTVRTSRTVVLIISMVAVALATKTAPKAKVVINVPRSFVKNGSMVFFNKDFHGRLILFQSLKERFQKIQQFAVSQATKRVSYADPCFSSCKFSCDAQVQQCICKRGFEMKQGGCQDVDECTSSRHNCHVQSTCSNTNGGFKCMCNDGFWGDGLTCHVCSVKPCPEGFYESESCTGTRDRVCKACSPKCGGVTYEAYGCGLKFDRKCVDISKPLTLSKMANESEHYRVQSGSKLTFLHPTKDHVLLEDRFQLNSTSTTFLLQKNSSNETQIHRNSSFVVDVRIESVGFIPRYKDYDATKSNENLEFAGVRGFAEVFMKRCRFPAPNHYEVKHELHRNRQTRVYQTTCFEHSQGLCPSYVTPGEFYYFRSLNDACDTAEEAMVCRKRDQRDCRLKEELDRLYCTNYTNILSGVFGIKEPDFMESPLQSFPTRLCADAYRSCSVCRDGCSSCDHSASGSGTSCSCCYKKCLHDCSPYYRLSDCTRIPKRCAKGDTSQFTLTMSKPADLNLQFNCFLEYDFPKALYTLKYRVRHQSGRFNSSWISKTLKTLRRDQSTHSNIQHGTNRLDFLEVKHSTNLDISPLLYLRGHRSVDREPYAYSVTSLDGKNASLGNANVTEPIKFQTTSPFRINTKTWSNGENCQTLSKWTQTIRKPFLDLKPIKVNSIEVLAGGEFSYQIQDPRRLPMMSMHISKDQSVLKYVLRNSTIRNDETFQSSLLRRNTTWSIKISGVLTSCPGFFTLQVIDEVEEVKVLEQDVVILCPEKSFRLDIHVPRLNSDKERLFSIFLSDSKQRLKLQLALVDKNARIEKDFNVETSDENPNPAVTLMPLFVATGCVLLCLLGLIIYAQVTHKSDEDAKNGTAGWKFVKTQENKNTDTEYNRPQSNSDDDNRLKRRHLILVAFLVTFRIVYSVVFSFTVAFTILSLLHGPNLEILMEYQEFVQSKINESNAMALQMDQHREREVKHSLDATEDIQRSCDFYLRLQLRRLQYNMTCLIQENHLKIFNKLSKKIVKQVTEKVGELRKAIDTRIEEFQGRVKRKLQDTKERLQDYAKRVYSNGWFALPRGAYDINKGISRRKRRNLAVNYTYITSPDNYVKRVPRDAPSKTPQNIFSIRAKRSLADGSFIGFLDFVGVVDQDKLVETEKKIKEKLQFLKDGLADFSEVLKAGKTPEHPFSTILMCPLRFMLGTAKEQAVRGIRKIAIEGEEWARANSACFVGNISDFFASNDSTKNSDFNEMDHGDSFAERITYEEIEGVDEIGNTSTTNKSSLLESAHGRSSFNIEKGDIMEENVDQQKKELLEKEGKISNVTSVYDSEVFILTKKAILGVVVVIDILLLIYRGSKTYQIALSLIQGFEEIVEHDENEFKENPLSTKQKAARFLGRFFDFLARIFTKFLNTCKSIQKKVMRTNLLPICIIITASAAVIYLLIAVVLNVMNVNVIEALGGFDLIASRLDTDFNFTNLAIADQIDFINNNDMRLYKQSMSQSMSEFIKMVEEFNKDQQQRIDELKQQLCSLENETAKCFEETDLFASFLSFEPQVCIIPTLKGTPYDGYDGKAYRQRLKRESARFIDAIRNVILNTIYFLVGVILVVLAIAVVSFAAFRFLKSRGMVRVKRVHVYKALPYEIVEQFHMKSVESDDELDGEKKSETQRDHRKKLEPAKRFLAASQERLNPTKKSPKDDVLGQTIP